MRLSRFVVCAAFVCASFTLALNPGRPVHAVDLISNFAGSSDTLATQLASNPNVSVTAGFTLASGVNYTLDSATLRLQVLDSSRTITLGLYESNAGNPTANLLTAFTVPAFTVTGINTYTFIPSSAVTLQEGTTYWLTAIGTGSGTVAAVRWVSSNPGITPTGLATSAGYRFSGAAANPPTDNLGASPTYSIQATAITAAPEPASLALCAIAVVGVTVRRKRHAE